MTAVEWRPAASGAGAPCLMDTETEAHFPIGTIIEAEGATYGPCKLIYLKGVASTLQYSWVSYTLDDYSTALLAASAVGPVAISLSANVADQYGWYGVYGKFPGRALTGFADNGLVYATATAGSVDDAVVSGDLVVNARGASALDTPSTGLAEFELYWPTIA